MSIVKTYKEATMKCMQKGHTSNRQ